MIGKTAYRAMALGLLALLATYTSVQAQEAVVAVADKEALLTSPDPFLNANKQVVYHIMRDLLEAGHWDKADRFLTERYLQHNPNVPSLVQWFRSPPSADPARYGQRHCPASRASQDPLRKA